MVDDEGQFAESPNFRSKFLWLTGAPKWLFRSVPSVASDAHLAAAYSRSSLIARNEALSAHHPVPQPTSALISLQFRQPHLVNLVHQIFAMSSSSTTRAGQRDVVSTTPSLLSLIT